MLIKLAFGKTDYIEEQTTYQRAGIYIQSGYLNTCTN